jgi:hypothetical protein
MLSNPFLSLTALPETISPSLDFRPTLADANFGEFSPSSRFLSNSTVDNLLWIVETQAEQETPSVHHWADSPAIFWGPLENIQSHVLVGYQLAVRTLCFLMYLSYQVGPLWGIAISPLNLSLGPMEIVSLLELSRFWTLGPTGIVAPELS